MDLTKAFDLVNHNVLLDKLYQYGIRGSAFDWFKDYLSNRMQHVDINGFCSDNLTPHKGVPQGSVLGPLLYIIYVNDMPLENAIMFADDTSLIISEKSKLNIVDAANSELDAVDKYMDANDLIINSKKSTFIEFKARSHDRDHSLLLKSNGASIPQVESIKFLGIFIDYRCNWQEHVRYLSKKLASACFVLRRLRSEVSSHILKTYYYAHFHSLLSYGLLAWGSSNEIERIFVLQKKAIRIMNRINPRDSCKPYFRSMGILTLPCLHIMQLLLFARQNIDNINKLNDFHKYGTRNSSVLEIPKHRLSFYERNPYYLSIKAYNALPQNFKNIPDAKFKFEIKQLLIQKSYYTVSEFLNQL